MCCDHGLRDISYRFTLKRLGAFSLLHAGQWSRECSDTWILRPTILVFKRLGAFSLIHAGQWSHECPDTWISRLMILVYKRLGALVLSMLVNGATSAQTRGF